MRHLIPIFILAIGTATSIPTGHEQLEEDLTHDQLMALIRPTLSPTVQGILDEIQADPLLKRLNDLDPWQRVQLSIQVLMRNSTYRSMIMEEGMKRIVGSQPRSYDFPCTPLPHSKIATSVHELTPSDIKVVAAMGDSITAGFGIDATNVLDVLKQYRGQSWSVGGEETFETNPMLPNILRKYNSGITGFSTGTCKATQECSHLNVAVGGKTARDIANQARTLVNKIKASPSIDVQNDWKMVTIFIGNNDICNRQCLKPSDFTAEIYRQRLKDALDILYELPRTFVNLVSMVDAYECKNLNIGPICTGLHLVECPCAAFLPFYKKSKALNDAYQEETRSLAASYRSRDDFIVVLQPFFQNTILPRKSDGEIDLSYFSSDCFHFSAKGHAAGALSLWNNLLEPVGKKKTSWHEGEPYSCPTEKQPYFCTNKNCCA